MNQLVIDLETTHLEVYKARIVQIGLIYQGQSKTILINPTIPIPPQASNVNHIYDHDVVNAPTFTEVAPKLIKIIEECDCIITYNGDAYDIPILYIEFLRSGIVMPNKISYDVYRMLTMHEGSRKLKDAYRRYMNKELVNAHDAGADCNATFELYNYLIEKLKQ